MTKFTDLGLDEKILQAIAEIGFERPSEVQEKTIPILLQQDTDIISLAQTGTGKTAAFGFPLIQKINAQNKHTQGLILSPTRELCLQITNELKNYSRYIPNIHTVAVYGGASITEQAREIKRGAQLVVATPGRIKDLINRNLIDISKIDYCVLDEADEMLNMGFYEDITDILSHTPNEKKTWLFSATMPREVATIARKFMRTPVEITIGVKNTGSKNVSHEYYVVNARDRYQALRRLADANPDIFSVIFCRTKSETQKVAENLIEDGYNAAALHGDLSQNQRDLVMKSFRSKQIQMLVATDVAARGIDVDDITHVINYQLPDDKETYTHRSGRTGRAGKTGISISIVSKSELRKILHIEKTLQQKFVQKNIPNGMEICEIQLFHLANSIKNTEINSDIDSYLPNIEEVLSGLSREDIIKKVFSVEFSRFYSRYKNAKDLNASGDSHSTTEKGNSVRYFINIGRKDGFDWMDVKDLIRDLAGLGKDEVFHVDAKETFSFFNTSDTHVNLIMGIFENFKLEGRKVHVEISSEGRKERGKFRKKEWSDKPDFSFKSKKKKAETSFKPQGTGGKRRRRS